MGIIDWFSHNVMLMIIQIYGWFHGLASNDMVFSFLETHSALTGGMIIAFSYLFQIYKLYTTKSADGISVWFWVVLSVALTFLLINSITIFVLYGSWGYMLAEFLNVSLALVVLGMVIHYKRKA